MLSTLSQVAAAAALVAAVGSCSSQTSAPASENQQSTPSALVDTVVPLDGVSALTCDSGLVASESWEVPKRFNSIEAIIERFWVAAPARFQLSREDVRAKQVTPELIVFYNEQDEGKASIGLQPFGENEWIIGEWSRCSIAPPDQDR